MSDASAPATPRSTSGSPASLDSCSATDFAVLFMPLRSAQTATGQPGAVNDLVLRIVRGADRDRVQAQLAAAVAKLGATVTTRDDDPVYRGLYADARNDQKT